jgi:transcriptional regulator of arginine metabolism
MYEYTKTRRQAVLREVITRQRVGGQDRLLAELRERGIRTTQATISRDLQEMGVVKARVEPGVYAYSFEILNPASRDESSRRLKVLFADFVTDVRAAANLVVVRTSPGNANGVASLIDGLERPGILGTVAGDDTILVVVDTEARRAEVEREFRALLQGS